MNLFPEKYRPCIGKNHKISAALAALLVVLGFAVFIFSLFLSSAALLSNVRFKLALVSFFCIPAGLAILLAVKKSVQNRYHGLHQGSVAVNQQAEDSRRFVKENMTYRKFDYHAAPRQNIESTLFILVLIFATMVFLNAIILGMVLMIPIALMSGIMWTLDRRRRNDFVEFSAEGISFHDRGTIGFMHWDQIREIEYCQRWYVIKAQDARLRISKDIVPADLPRLPFFKRFISNTRYDTDLISQIQTMAPHVRNVQWYNYSRM
jgi:hypothetical protein